MFTIHTLPLGFTETNCYILEDEATRTAVVIDPGDEAGQILRLIKERQLEIKAVLLTHAHFDHIGAVGELVEATPAPLAIHPLELPLYRAGGGAALFGLPLRHYPEPSVLIEPGQPLSFGPFTLEVLFVPGHTLGHVALYHAPTQAVFSGDVLFQDSIGRTDLPGGNYATLMHSIKSVLMTLPAATTIYSGHGPATTLAREAKANPFLAE
ncbi:MAG: MBL fold metallo-hydrolase [Anaerolineales bacterium]|nr:MBL fold metallo-hydrolase [Anaerolineales bacterium]